MAINRNKKLFSIKFGVVSKVGQQLPYFPDDFCSTSKPDNFLASFSPNIKILRCRHVV